MPEVGSRVQISSAPKAWSCGRENAIDAERRSRSAVGAIAASDIVVHRAAWRVVATAYAKRVVDIEPTDPDSIDGTIELLKAALREARRIKKNLGNIELSKEETTR